MLSRCFRGYFLTIFSILVYGFGIAGMTYGIYYYHTYKEGKLDAGLLSILYIADILALACLIIAIITAFLHKYVLTIISTILLIIATIVNLIIPIILLVAPSIYRDLAKKVWTDSAFTGLNKQIEADQKCCGWDSLDPTTCGSVYETCQSVFDIKVVGNKVFIAVFFFILVFIDHFAVIISIFAIVDDKYYAIQIGNEDNNQTQEAPQNTETSAKSDPEQPAGSDSDSSESATSHPTIRSMPQQHSPRNYQPPQINPMPNFLVQKQLKQQKQTEESYSYYYEEEEYTLSVDSDSESK